VYQHQSHTQRGEEIQVDGEIGEASVVHQLAAERNDKRLAAKGMNIRRRRLEPVDEPVLRREAQAPSRRRIVRFGRLADLLL
jgi:hypothetical protein